MAVSEALVEQVVRETSQRMQDAQYAQLAIGHFAEQQPRVVQYLAAIAARLGGEEGVVQLAFHAELLCECLRRSSTRALPVVEWEALDVASREDPVAVFARREPALASYVASNLEAPAWRLELCRIGIALLDAD